ncbi:hypothetical protein PR202_gb17522 [Eleusine coracana subsp. coracana]|uniref:F-box domain-containing protein n=1 Tax=Eleusine coracana subsp. coracana TaxID=191504 RepID=A0AAV5F4G9_ELECO|nr:hypothetical protein PR202_gb17522 [Eleusine coracana subsp. coracana]
MMTKSFSPSGCGFKLPTELTYEILLRLPIKSLGVSLCVCKEWQHLISSQKFITEHSSRSKPLLISSFMEAELKDNDMDCYLSLIDMESGSILINAIKYVKDIHVRCSCSNLVCVSGYGTGVQVINIVTRETIVDLTSDDIYDQILPDGSLLVDAQVTDPFMPRHFGFGRRENTNPVWRKKGCPSLHICSCASCMAYIDGVLYFLPNHKTSNAVASDTVLPFDLEDEEWKNVIRGPLSMYRQLDGTSSISLATLNGSLSLVDLVTHGDDQRPAADPHADIWVLADVDSGIWVKGYTIRLASLLCNMQVVNILIDGRIAFVNGERSILWLYDPKTGACKEVLDLTNYYAGGISIYTGSLLSSANYRSQLD